MSESLRVKRAFLILFSAGLGAQAFLFLGMLVLARLYSPEAFGEYGFYAGLAAAITIVAGGRFDYLAFIKAASNYGKVNFYFVSLIICLAACAFVFISAWAAKGFWPERLLFEWWTLFFVISSSLFYLGTQHLLAQGYYIFFSRVRFFQIVCQVSSGFLVYFIWPHFGLSLAFAGSQLILGGFLLSHFLRNYGVPNYSETLLVMRDFRERAFFNSLISILQYSTPFAPIFFGSIIYSKGEVGAYFLFSQVAAAPLGVFRRSLLNFLNAEFYSVDRLINIRLTRSRKMFFYIFSALLLLVVSGLVLMFFREEIVALLFGKQWLMYVALLVPLAIYYVVDAFLQPVTTLLPLWGFTKVSLVFEAFRFLLVYVGGGVAVFLMSVEFNTFVMFFVSSMAFVYFMQALYLGLFLMRKINA